jgi:hypothetical protein
MLIIDGARYRLYIPKEEKKLEEMIIEHSKDIFGNDSIYFDKRHKLKSVSGVVSIPDGYALSLSKPFRWYIVEGELSSHPLHDHITSQLNKFYTGIKNLSTQRELIDALYDEIDGDKVLRAYVETMIGSREIKGYLLDLISKQPGIVVIIEEMGEKVREACDGLKTAPIIREFKTFVREDAPNVHAHLFEPLDEQGIVEKPKRIRARKGEITSQDRYTLPILGTLIEMGGAGTITDVLEGVFKKMKDILTPKDLEKLSSGISTRWANKAQWERQRLKTEGYLKPDSYRGTWEITEKGRKLYQDLKNKV